jgi:sulfatase modifying factor 1
LSCCTPSRNGSVPPQTVAVERADNPDTQDRVYFRGGTSFVGTDRPEIPQDGEGPRREITLAPFWLDTAPVTNARFERFVAETGYITEAERFSWSPVFRGLLGSNAPLPSATRTPWWVKVDGASWRAPEGPGTSTEGREDHPVVHVSWADARAFGQWCGGRLPTEAEWEHAARGGLADPRFPWGDAEPDDQTVYANIWQGEFPHRNILTDGYMGTCPVTAFPANGLGLYSMAGNVWEWTNDAFKVRSLSRQAKARNEHAALTQEKVLKGGSFLCHISYCYRYRIAARSALTAESSASNSGFRVAYDK